MPRLVAEITLTLIDDELVIATRAIEQTRNTFEMVVADGHMESMPPMPELLEDQLTLPLDVDVLEEFDYQLTIGIRDNVTEETIGIDPCVGDHLASRIIRSLPPDITLSSITE